MKKITTLYFVLLISGYSFSQECKGLTRKVDKFTGDISIYRMDDEVSYAKFIKGVDTSVFLVLACNGSTLNYSKEGAIILLSDGSKIDRPTQKIDVKAASQSGYKYSAFIELKKEDIVSLTKNTITDFKLYIYDQEVPERHRQQNADSFKCVLAEK